MFINFPIFNFPYHQEMDMLITARPWTFAGLDLLLRGMHDGCMMEGGLFCCSSCPIIFTQLATLLDYDDFFEDGMAKGVDGVM